MKFLVIAAFAALGGATAVEACPDFNQFGESYEVTGQQLRSRQTLRVTAGGENYIWNCSNVRPGTDQGAGYFTTVPDFTIKLNGMAGLQLVLSVQSACDSALLVNTASANWYYDDDDNGNLDPRIVLTRPVDGWLDIWVGTYDGQYCDAILSLETFRR